MTPGGPNLHLQHLGQVDHRHGGFAGLDDGHHLLAPWLTGQQRYQS